MPSISDKKGYYFFILRKKSCFHIMRFPHFWKSNAVIEVLNNNDISLKETLRPLWILTCKSGILLDWIRIDDNKAKIIADKKTNRILFPLRCVTIFLVFITFLMIGYFELYQLLTGINKMIHISSIIPNLLWFVPIPIGIVTMTSFIFNRGKYLKFFDDWEHVETELSSTFRTKAKCNKKVHYRVMYAVYMILGITSLVTIGIDMIKEPDSSYLLSSLPFMTRLIPMPFLVGIQLLVIYCFWIQQTTVDLVPAFVYYHISLALGRLESDLHTLFDLQSSGGKFISTGLFKIEREDFNASVLHLWSRYENIAVMVGRANRLFGVPVLIAAHGLTLFMICTLTYSTFHSLKDFIENLDVVFVSHAMTLLVCIFRLISCTLFSAKLNDRSVQLRNTLAWSLSQHWNRIPTIQDREMLVVINGRLHQDPLTASPLGLYDIKYSTLLTILGLVASYVIILLQSK